MAQLSQEEKDAEATGQDGEAQDQAERKQESVSSILNCKTKQKSFDQMVNLDDNFVIWFIKVLKRTKCEELFAMFMLMNGYKMEDGVAIYQDLTARIAWHFCASIGMQVLPGMFINEGQAVRQKDSNEGSYGDDVAYEYKKAESFEECRLSIAINLLLFKFKMSKRKKDIKAFTNYLINLGNQLEDQERDAQLFYVPPEIAAQVGIQIGMSSEVYGPALSANDNVDGDDKKDDGNLLQKSNMDNKSSVNRKQKKRGKPSKKGKKNKNRRNRGKGRNATVLKKEQDDKKDDEEDDFDELFNWLHVQQ